MKTSIKWLEDFIDLSGYTPQDIAHKLTMAGLEVEELRDRFNHLDRVVAAVVNKMEPVAKSDRLNYCEVEAGSFGNFKVICGAPNVRKGLVTPLALTGVTLPGDLTIGTTEIRGLVSQGMRCSEAELGLGTDATGIMELVGVEPGKTLRAITGRTDWVLEIAITPNRPDGLSMIGLARDLSALLNRPLKNFPKGENSPPETGPEITSLAKVTIEAPEHCHRYVARVITGVKIGPSPQWLVERLASVGQRSINNVVDITNYVMLEMGLPLHAFDLKTLAGQEIRVKAYPCGTRFTTLDGQERELTSEINLMICDGQKPVALAGVMGGLNSEIEDHTQDILLEGAYFNPATIRRTSRSQGLSSEASYRFERGADPEICLRAVNRAMCLMSELAAGQVATGYIDCYPRPFKTPAVLFSPSRCNAYLGTSHKDKDMVRVLTAIGLKLEVCGDNYQVALPSWRPDLSREVDVWEEVARLLDFDNLPSTLPKPPPTRQAPPDSWILKNSLREHLVDRGFSENISYSFINPNFTKKFMLGEDSVWMKRLLPVLNPLSEEQGVLRPLLAPSLLTALRLNQGHGQVETSLFEVGTIFLSNGTEEQPEERLTLGAIWSGFCGAGNWIEPRRPVDFWDMKGLAESLSQHLNLKISFRRTKDTPAWYDSDEAAGIDLKFYCNSGNHPDNDNDNSSKPFGHIGRLHKKVAKAYGLRENNGPVYLLELDAQLILDTGGPRVRTFRGWSKFPPNERDMALVLDRRISAADVLREIQAEASIPLEGALLFDLYEGDQLPPDKKSLAFRLSFQSLDKTLTDEEVNGYFETITTRLAQRLGAALRT